MNNLKAWDRIWAETKDDKEFRLWVEREIQGVRGRKIIRYIEKYLGKINGLKIIEIGAGTGVYSFIFARYGAKVTLLDYSQEAILLARKYFDSAGLSASFLCADALNLEKNLWEKFDIAMSFGTIEHYRYPQRFMIAKTHMDLVRPGGTIIISVPNCWFFPHEILKFYLQRRNKWQLGYEGSFNRFELLRLGNRIGLENMEIRGSAFITDTFRYFHIFQESRLFKKFCKVHPVNLSAVNTTSFFDDLLGADIFLMGCKSSHRIETK